MIEPSREVKITRDGDWYVVSDEGGEFARATTIDGAVRYVADLLHGPGTRGASTFDELVSVPLQPVSTSVHSTPSVPSWPTAEETYCARFGGPCADFPRCRCGEAATS